jgi:hypothetical protein
MTCSGAVLTAYQFKILLYRLADGSGIDVLDTRGLNEGGKPEEADSAETAVGM